MQGFGGQTYIPQSPCLRPAAAVPCAAYYHTMMSTPHLLVGTAFLGKACLLLFAAAVHITVSIGQQMPPHYG